MFKVIRKADVVLFFVLILFGLTLSWLSVRGASSGTTVRIRVDGEDYGEYSLYEDRTVTIRQKGGKKNVVSIEGGQVTMKSSTCKNQICVNHAAIHTTNQSIVCLPNRVSVEIAGGEDGDIDALS